jgi:uncharacterized membrane protein (UPF0127 family)
LIRWAPLWAAGTLWLASCGAGPARPSPSPTPTPATVTGPRAVLPSGAIYRLELARTPEEQGQGLMYRESLPANTGMLFLFSDQMPHHFYMKNTMMPLDIIWLDAEARVLFVSANTPPCVADPCPTYGPDGPVAMVLEIAGGLAAREEVKVGSVLKLMEVER